MTEKNEQRISYLWKYITWSNACVWKEKREGRRETIFEEIIAGKNFKFDETMNPQIQGQ